MTRKNIFLLILCIFLTACAKKAPEIKPPSPTGPEIRDLVDFPQNLEVYAKIAGPNRQLLSQARQDEMEKSFINTLFGPWHMTRSSIRKKDVAALFGRARGYKDATRMWSQPEWSDMLANAGLASFPNKAISAITLRNTDLRELPTHEYRFTEPTANIKDNPFDYFQYSLLPAGTPLLVAHTSRDGRWHYVECPIAGGWVDANDVAYVDANFKSLWQSGKYAALVKDKVTLPGTGLGGGDSQAGIGTVLPAAPGWSNASPRVYVPIRGSTGFAESAEVDLAPDSTSIMPLPLTPANVARIGNQFMGQPYGWGGMAGLRDCSAMTRDILTPFGIWLPRNSSAQARRGSVISLNGLSPSEKAAIILRSGVPFLSLVGMKGHIALYVGEWKGKPAIFHNTWGERIVRNDNDNERLVIGRTVVTSISPGKELKNLYRPVTFTDRIRSLSTPGY